VKGIDTLVQEAVLNDLCKDFFRVVIIPNLSRKRKKCVERCDVEDCQKRKSSMHIVTVLHMQETAGLHGKTTFH
jgi:hypothetical protein